MFLRVLLIAVVTLASSTAFAQKTPRDFRRELPKAATDQVSLDPDSVFAPLPNLPALSGQTWRHWIVPSFRATDSSLKKTLTYKVRIVNIGNLPLTAKIECYADGGSFADEGKRKFRGSKNLKARGISSLKPPPGWCRVSADKPIFVYAEEIYRVNAFKHNDKTAPFPLVGFYTRTIPAHPYPAE